MLIRHTTPNVQKGICYGITDLNVADGYANELEEIKAKLDAFEPDQIFTSPLIRCKQLANDVYASKPIKEDDRLCEIDFGKWEMVKWSDIPADDINRWSEDLFEFKIPNGERFKDLYNRVINFWDECISQSPTNNIAIFTHSGVIRSLLMQLLDISPKKIFNLELSYGTIIEITHYSSLHSTVKFQ